MEKLEMKMNTACDDKKFQSSGVAGRTLTEEEIMKLEEDTCLVSAFKQLKLEKEAQKNWDLFYKRNTTKFFKDRHWTKREFEELCKTEISNGKLTIFEAGCGVGNFIFPLLEEDKEGKMFIYACDFSPRAVNFVKENQVYDVERCHAFQCDLTQHDLTENIPKNSVDIATLIFVLSAIHPDKMARALENILEVLKPDGCLLFRDYGLFDHAMLRFSKGHKLSDQFYVRQDGTRAYYFSIEEIKCIFGKAGFAISSIEYIYRETVNYKEGLSVPRIFVQAKFTKPNSSNCKSKQYCTSQTSFIESPASTKNVQMESDLIKHCENSKRTEETVLVNVSQEVMSKQSTHETRTTEESKTNIEDPNLPQGHPIASAADTQAVGVSKSVTSWKYLCESAGDTQAVGVSKSVTSLKYLCESAIILKRKYSDTSTESTNCNVDEDQGNPISNLETSPHNYLAKRTRINGNDSTSNQIP